MRCQTEALQLSNDSSSKRIYTVNRQARELMMYSEYFDKAKAELNIDTDYKLAIELGINRSTIARMKAGNLHMDDYTAFRLAEVLNIDPRIIIARTRLIKEKNPEKLEFWKEQLKKYTALSDSNEKGSYSHNKELC